MPPGDLFVATPMPNAVRGGVVIGAQGPTKASGIAREEGEEVTYVAPPPQPTNSFSSTRTETPRKAMRECDFDSNPTKLYLHIQEKRWNEAVERSRSHPEEAFTWVSRKERDGKLRWRLLPLHAAIIFKATDKTIEALLCAYPPGAQCKDDQGMLPIHLAFRNGSSEGVVNLLLVAYPQSIDVKDRKGRVPLVLAQASTSPNKDAFVRALERGPSYYAVAAAATERAAVTAEQRALFDSKMLTMTKEHEQEIEELKAKAQSDTDELKAKVAALEEELAKTQETSQVLVDHVNSLEAQLSSRSDTERFLATKIANLDSALKESNRAKEQIESKIHSERDGLQIEVERLTNLVNQLQEELETFKSKAVEAEEALKRVSTDKVDRRSRLDDKVKMLENERAKAMANAAVLEAQLKRKIETEHSLATQVSDLAGKLAESAAATSKASTSYVKRIDALEMEKSQLQRTVSLLTEKLSHVAKALDAMALEQERIVSAAAKHEETMAMAAVCQQQIVADASRQEQILLDAVSEREQIVSILTRQAEEIERCTSQRESILLSVKKQEEEMARATLEREGLINMVSHQRKHMSGLQQDIRELCKNSSDEYDDYDDEEEYEEPPEYQPITTSSSSRINIHTFYEPTPTSFSFKTENDFSSDSVLQDPSDHVNPADDNSEIEESRTDEPKVVSAKEQPETKNEENLKDVIRPTIESQRSIDESVKSIKTSNLGQSDSINIGLSDDLRSLVSDFSYEMPEGATAADVLAAQKMVAASIPVSEKKEVTNE